MKTSDYRPSEAGSDFAKELTLFYVVPANPADDSLSFMYDGDTLCEECEGVDETLDPA